MPVRGRLSKVFASLAAIAALIAINVPGPALAQPGRDEPMRIITIPKFVVTAVNFKALDETGVDWPGDDEVAAVLVDFNPVQERHTSVYWNVDSGETKKFAAADRCIAPRPDCDRGAHALHFAVALWERDDAPWPFANFCYGSITGGLEHYEGGICSGDDLIGRAEISLSQAQLVAALPNVGDTADYTVKPSGGDDGSYEFTYRITRLANVRIPVIVGPGRPDPLISLQASVSAGGGGARVTLAWSGATTANVDIYRNGPAVATTPNDGNYVEALPAGTYQYRVCNTGSTTFCSAVASVTVP